MKILFLVPYPLHEAPSQRFRFEQYFEALHRSGHQFHIQSFLTSQGRRNLLPGGNAFRKVATLLRGFGRRLIAIFHAPAYDAVFIHREAAPVGPPFVEWIIARILRRRIIFDFDDAIWLTDNVAESKWQSSLRWRSKVGQICRMSYRVSCGNEYLAGYARQFNNAVTVMPTTIDTMHVHNPSLFEQKQDAREVVIGWTGTFSTLKYLEPVAGILNDIAGKYPQVRIVVIADRHPSFHIDRMTFVPWSRADEILQLTKIDIGIMPLTDDEWTRGKCGFKALQFMALNIPTVASPVGVNSGIIQHGVDGYLAATPEEWVRFLTRLVTDPEERLRLGNAARVNIEQRYSVISNSSLFLGLFE